MNLLNDHLLLGSDSIVDPLGGLRFSRSSAWSLQGAKFKQFFANLFFLLKKRKDAWKEFGQLFGSNPPHHLIPEVFKSFLPGDEAYSASKSTEKPWKCGIFRVVAGQHDFVHSTSPSLGYVMLDSQTAFGVDESSKVSEIFLGWRDRVQQLLGLFLSVEKDESLVGLQIGKFLYTRDLIRFRSTAKKIDKSQGFIPLFNQVWKAFSSKIEGFRSTAMVLVKNLMVLLNPFFPARGAPLELGSKPADDFEVCRSDDDRGLELRFGLSDVETSISVEVTSRICKCGVFHAQDDAWGGVFESTSNRSDNPTEMARSDVDTVIQTLAGNNAYTIADNIEGDDKFGTAPVRDAYFALASTSLIRTIENVTGFIAKAQYPYQASVLRPEWGSVSNLRFLVSSIGSVSPNASGLGNDVYNVFCVGMEAYACIEQDGYSAQFIYRPPIYDGPLALNASVGYKFAEVPRITNDAWVINLRTTQKP